MLELLIFAIVGVLAVSLIEMDIVIKIIIMALIGLCLIGAYSRYEKKVKELKNIIEFLQSQVLEINEQLYKRDGDCPLKNTQIKEVDGNDEGDNNIDGE